MPSVLNIALDELDHYLSANNLSIEIVICGAFAIQLHGFTRNEITQDIDSIKEISNHEVLAEIAHIGAKLGLKRNWLNDMASTVSFPEGAIERAKPIQKWKSIQARLVSREDLILMKTSAYFIRRDYTEKDYEDLILLNPTLTEIELAIEFVRRVNGPPKNAPKKILTDFEESVNDVKKLVK
jgi:hypothetical protein